MEKEANEIFDQIDALGGVIPAIETGYFQKEIADSAYRYQKEVERKEKFIVGVNEFVEPDEKIEIPILQISPEVQKKQNERLAELRSSRNNAEVERSLEEIRSAAADGKNLMPQLIKAAHNYVTLGEMVDELKKVFGIYQEASVF
jgi:methylmalonyl-CoA mutase N-terminal domain/subunit